MILTVIFFGLARAGKPPKSAVARGGAFADAGAGPTGSPEDCRSMVGRGGCEDALAAAAVAGAGWSRSRRSRAKMASLRPSPNLPAHFGSSSLFPPPSRRHPLAINPGFLMVKSSWSGSYWMMPRIVGGPGWLVNTQKLRYVAPDRVNCWCFTWMCSVSNFNCSGRAEELDSSERRWLVMLFLFRWQDDHYDLHATSQTCIKEVLNQLPNAFL